MAWRSASWQARAFSWAKNRPWTSKPGVVVDDQEQLGPHRGLDPWVRDPGPDQHVGDPALVGCLGLVAAEDLGLGGQRLAVRPRRASCWRTVRSATVMPWRAKRIRAIWAAERLGSSRRSAAASSASSGWARTAPVSERGARGEGLRGRPGARPGSSGRWWLGCSGAPCRRDGCALVRRWPAPAPLVRPVRAGRSSPRRSPPSGAARPLLRAVVVHVVSPVSVVVMGQEA